MTSLMKQFLRKLPEGLVNAGDVPLTSTKSTFSQPFKEKCINEVMRMGSIIMFHLSKLRKAKFLIITV